MKSPDPWVCFESVEQPKRTFLRKSRVRVSPNDRGFMFADGVYEVIRSYQGKALPSSGTPEASEAEPALSPYCIQKRQCNRSRSLGTAAPQSSAHLRRNRLSPDNARRVSASARIPAPTVIPTFYMEVNRFEPYRVEITPASALLPCPTFAGPGATSSHWPCWATCLPARKQ